MPILERLALALGVPLCEFFFRPGETTSTPRLTPRATFEQLTRDELLLSG
jgi:hypothetical protein